MLRALVVLLGLSAIGAISAVAGVVGAYYYVQPGLPAAETIGYLRGSPATCC
jgi:hypothetical protein